MDPSGRKAYVSCSADNKVAVIDLASLSVTGEIKTDEAPDGIAWANLDGTGTGSGSGHMAQPPVIAK